MVWVCEYVCIYKWVSFKKEIICAVGARFRFFLVLHDHKECVIFKSVWIKQKKWEFTLTPSMQKWYLKFHLLSAGIVNVASAKKWGIAGGTVLKPSGSTSQTLKMWGIIQQAVWWHSSKWYITKLKHKSAVGGVTYQGCVRHFWSGYDRVLRKLATHHQNCCGVCWHLTVLVPTMLSFTLWCDPPEILLWLSQSLWVFLTVMWHIVKIYCGWPINYYPWS